jgi:hypothetical protein
VLNVFGTYTTFQDLELACSTPSRADSGQANDPTGIAANDSTHIRFVNLIVHDMPGQGFGLWTESVEAEVYGTIVYYNGTNHFDHGIYTQNATGTKRIEDNIIFGQASHGIHAFGSEAAALDHFYIAGNVIFNNGLLVGQGERNILVGGLRVARDLTLVDNFTYYPPASARGANNLGYSAGCADAKVTGNYFVGPTALALINCLPSQLAQNVLIGALDPPDLLAGNPQNQHSASLPRGSRVDGQAEPLSARARARHRLQLGFAAAGGRRSRDVWIDRWSTLRGSRCAGSVRRTARRRDLHGRAGRPADDGTARRAADLEPGRGAPPHRAGIRRVHRVSTLSTTSWRSGRSLMTQRATAVDAGALHATPRDLLSDIFGWDVVTWSPSLEHWQRHATVDFTRSNALEIGAGQSGGVSLWLALQGCDVTCSTFGEVPPRVRALHGRYGVAHRVRYTSLDVLELCEQNTYDVIAFKSVLGGIGANDRADLQARAIARIHAALKPGGNLLFAENLAATRVHATLRRRFGAGKDGWRYLTMREMLQLMRPFASVHYRTAGFLGAWGSSEIQLRTSGALDGFLCRWLVPASWQYVVMGVAIK